MKITKGFSKVFAICLAAVMLVTTMPTYAAISQTNQDYLDDLATEIFKISKTNREVGITTLVELYDSADDSKALADEYVDAFGSFASTTPGLYKNFEMAVYALEILSRYADKAGVIDDLADSFGSSSSDDFVSTMTTIIESYPEALDELRDIGVTKDSIPTAFDQFDELMTLFDKVRQAYNDPDSNMEAFLVTNEKYADLSISGDDLRTLIFMAELAEYNIEYDDAHEGFSSLIAFYNRETGSVRSNTYDLLDGYGFVRIVSSNTGGGGGGGGTTPVEERDLIDEFLPQGGAGSLDDQNYVAAIFASIDEADDDEVIVNIVGATIQTFDDPNVVVTHVKLRNTLKIIKKAMDSVESDVSLLALLDQINEVVSIYKRNIQNGSIAMILADLTLDDSEKKSEVLSFALEALEVGAYGTEKVYSGYIDASKYNNELLESLSGLYAILNNEEKVMFVDELPVLLVALTDIVSTADQAVDLIEDIKVYYQDVDDDSRMAFDISYLLSEMANDVVEKEASVMNTNGTVIVASDISASLAKGNEAKGLLEQAFKANKVSLDRVIKVPAVVYTQAATGKYVAASINGTDLKAAFDNGADYVKVDTSYGFVTLESDMFDKAVEQLEVTIYSNANFEMEADGQSVGELAKAVKFSSLYAYKGDEDMKDLVATINMDGKKMLVPVQYKKAYYGVEFDSKYVGDYTLEHNSVTFNDIDEASWAVDYIAYLGAKGIVNGNNGDVMPQSNITRAEFVTILVRAFQLTGEAAEMPFTDVTKENWFYDPVSIAYSNGLINGKSATTFAPNEKITRQEIVKILGVLMTSKGFVNNLDTLTFEDQAMISAWALEGTELSVQEGVVGGYTDNTFRPNNNATRAEVMKMIYSLVTK